MGISAVFYLGKNVGYRSGLKAVTALDGLISGNLTDTQLVLSRRQLES